MVLIVGVTVIPAFVFPINASIVVCLLELVLLEFRFSAIATVYEIGNLATSLLPTIVVALAQRFPLTNIERQTGAHGFGYGKSMVVFLVCVYTILK